MPWPEWLRVSINSITKASRLRRSGRKDLIGAMERGEMSLDTALEPVEAKPPPKAEGKN